MPVHTVTLIKGDGIGPEVVAAAREVVEATGEPLPPSVLDSIRRNGVGLKGPVTTQVAEGMPSLNVRLRKELNLYACVRPIRSLPGVPCLHQDVDLTLVRENTEDLYAGIEHEILPGIVESLKLITRDASIRIADFAFRHAERLGYKRVTAVHKANIMKLSDGFVPAVLPRGESRLS